MLLNPSPDSPTASPLLARDMRLLGASGFGLVFLGTEYQGRFTQIWVRVWFLQTLGMAPALYCHIGRSALLEKRILPQMLLVESDYKSITCTTSIQDRIHIVILVGHDFVSL
jgi:hypothetical protein